MTEKNGRLNIVADSHIWGVESAFSSLPGLDVSLHVLEHSQINHEALMNTDILLTRSSTRVNAELLEGTPVRFAATATIGDDHYDKAWLDKNSIAHANAAGSSTASVLEYMVAALLELHRHDLISMPETCIGIIGAGRIGGGFEKVCRELGMNVLLNDPPRARQEGAKGFVELNGMLQTADVISLHTPLTFDGSDPTFHLIDQTALEHFKGRGVINAGRGGVVDNEALANWLDANSDHFAVLDCWENEPDISRRLLTHPRVVLATPHIAGHSLDGKAANTQYVHNALCRHLGIEPVWDMDDHLPKAKDGALQISATNDIWSNLQSAVAQLYDIAEDDRQFKSCGNLGNEALAQAFTRLRRHYPVRRAWDIHAIHFSPAEQETARLANAIGLRLI